MLIVPFLKPGIHLFLHSTGFTIKAVDTYKYLGLLFHKQLSWGAHVRQLIQFATPTSYQIARLATYHVFNRPSFKVIRQLVTSVLIPKLVYAIPFIQFPYPETHTIMRQMKRLIIYPLRRSLGLPNNAHHESIFIESSVLPLRYLLIYHSILFARRYINQAASQQDAQQRYHDIFIAAPLVTYHSQHHPLTIYLSVVNLFVTLSQQHMHRSLMLHQRDYGIWCLIISINNGTTLNTQVTLYLILTRYFHVTFMLLHVLILLFPYTYLNCTLIYQVSYPVYVSIVLVSINLFTSELEYNLRYALHVRTTP